MLTALAALAAPFAAYAVLALRRRPFGEPPETCVQIFAYNEEGRVGRCIESVLSQEVLVRYPYRFKVEVWDGGSTDNTVGVARSYGVAVHVLPRGKLLARNTAVLECDADVVVHLDADTVLPPWWLGNVLSRFEDPRVVAVTTPRLYEVPLVSLAVIPLRGFANLEGKVYGSNSAFRRWALARCLFDLDMDGRPGMVHEEEEQLFRCLSSLGEVAYEHVPAVTRPWTGKYVIA